MSTLLACCPHVQVVSRGAAAVLIGPCITFYFIREPVLMVKVGGITQAVLLPILGFCTLYLPRHYCPVKSRIESAG